MERDVEVICDGKSLPLQSFVATLFERTIAAMVGSLKGGEAATDITIVLKAKRK